MATQQMSRREELLTLAAKLFSEKGYNGASMQDLAKEAGMLRGSLYAHIDAKEDLLFEIVDQGANRFISRLETVLSSQVDSSQKLKDATRAHLNTIAEHLDAATVFLNDWKFLSPERLESIRAKRDHYEAMWRQIIEEGIRAGDFSDKVDARLAALMALSTVNWVYQWYRPDGSLGPEDLAEVFSNMILTGIERRS